MLPLLEKLMDAIHRDPGNPAGIAEFFNSAAVFSKSDFDNATGELKRRYKDEYIPDAVRRAEQTTSKSEVAYLNGVEEQGRALADPGAFFDAHPDLKGRLPQVTVEYNAAILRHTVLEITATAGKLDGLLVAPRTASFRRGKAEI